MNQNWQHNQRRMIRDRVAFVRFSRNAQPIQFNRVDVRVFGIIEGMDGWGRAITSDFQTESIWEDPIGRRFNSLSDAIQQIHTDRMFQRNGF
jgi:hypothetical protein